MPDSNPDIQTVDLRGVQGWSPVEIHFGTSGWRSLEKETKDEALEEGETKSFTTENVQLAAQAIAEYLKDNYEKNELDRGIIVSHGTREDSSKFARPVAEVLVANDIKVIFVLGYSPTPVSSFAVQDNNTLAGIHITASHNFYNSFRRANGLKFIPAHGGAAPFEVTNDLEKRINQKMKDNPILQTMDYDKALSGGLIDEKDVSQSYKDYVRSLIDFSVIKESDKKVFLDAMHGTSAKYIADLLTEANIDHQIFRAEPLHEVAGSLPADFRPEPAEEFLSELINSVQENENSFGIACDEDADRGGQIDSKGKFIHPNQAGSIYLWYLYHYQKVALEKLKQGIAKTVVTTDLLNALAEKIDIPLYETPVGFKHFVSYPDTVLKIEESAHFSGMDWKSWDDSLLEGLVMLEIEAKTGKSLSEVLSEAEDFVGQRFVYHRVNLGEHEGLTHALKEKLIEEIELSKQEKEAGKSLLEMTIVKKLQEFTSLEVKEVVTIDGIKLVFVDRSWLAFRPSGTEPVVRLYTEATSQEEQASHEKIAKKLLGITS